MNAPLPMPKVSVCIVTYNSGRYIADCLEAVRRQTWPRCEIVVVDNASTDDTAEQARRFEPDVAFVVNRENRGFAAGQNQAIRLSEGDYVLVLNPDVVLESNYVEVLVSRMERDKRIGSATGCLLLASSDGRIDSAGLTFDWKRRAAERGAGESAAAYGSAEEIFGVSGAAAMYARKMIDHVSVDGQFFDEDFFAYKEDVDVAWRARLLGWTSWYDPAARGRHVRQWGKHTSRRSVRLNIRQHSYINRYLMIVKNETFDLRWWLRLPALLAYELAWHGYLLLRDPAVFGGWGNLVRLLPAAWRKRKAIRQK